MSAINSFITNYLEYLEIEKNRSKKTIENYDRYLKRFINWSKIEKPDKINLEAVRKYRIFLNRFQNEKKETLKKNTQNYHLIALRSFLKYLAKQDIKTLAAEKIELGKTSVRQVEFLEPDELDRLLEASSKRNLIGLRDRAILELFFSTGLRVSELSKLNRKDINLKKDEFTVRGKGDKLRIVFLSEQAKSALKNYLDKRTDLDKELFIRIDRASPLSFPRRRESTIKTKYEESQESFRLTPRSIQRIVKKYALAAGITKKVTPHTIRHSYATDLLAAGADIRSVQTMLGHSSITTTQIYTHITDKKLKETYKSYHGKSK
jgi:site-specific recombinase XerD